MNNKTSDKPVILVVDDNPVNLRILIEYLEEANFETMVARSGEGAIRQVEFSHPDLVLLDIMMPGLDGFETCRLLKENETTRDIPIIFITALSDTEDKVRGFDLGAVDYITKPFQKEEVIARISTHLTILSQRKKLEELNATKDKFFSIIAHDMRNVFNGLIGTSWLIAKSSEKLNSEDLKMLGEKMHDSTKMAHNLLENLLSWSRIQKGAMKFAPMLINLNMLAAKAISYCKANAERKNINIFHAINPDTMIYADSNMIDTVLRNLLSNAIKFTHIGGAVYLSVNEIDSFLEISVQDTGIGISEEDIPKLLKIDSKFKREGTEGEQGTGLGLILCKEFIEKNGGKIQIESSEGNGSIFKFTIPMDSKK